jgi:lipid A 3-O-deacylase
MKTPLPNGLQLLPCVIFFLLLILSAPCPGQSWGAESAPLAPALTPVALTANAAPPADAPQHAKEPPLPTQYGMAAEYQYAYDPRPDNSYLLARAFVIYDYGSVWHQDCPNTLRFKVEAAVGSRVAPASGDLLASVNMLALKYPAGLGTALRPYLEAGIGIIYTQFRVKGQGFHVNFNPVLGAGCELPQQDGKNLFAAIRLYHLSNAEIDHENRGVNSVALQIGRYF